MEACLLKLYLAHKGLLEQSNGSLHCLQRHIHICLDPTPRCFQFGEPLCRNKTQTTLVITRCMLLFCTLNPNMNTRGQMMPVASCRVSMLVTIKHLWCPVFTASQSNKLLISFQLLFIYQINFSHMEKLSKESRLKIIMLNIFPIAKYYTIF